MIPWWWLIITFCSGRFVMLLTMSLMQIAHNSDKNKFDK